MRRCWMMAALVTVTFGFTAAIASPDSTGKKSANARLLELLLERNIITADEYQELAGLAGSEENATDVRRSDFAEAVETLVQRQGRGTGGSTGYDGGFSVNTDDGLFSLKIGAGIQARYTFNDFDSDRALDDTSSFSLERTRIDFSGHAFDPNVHYHVEMDLSDSTDGGSTSLKDAWIEWRNPEWYYAIRAGQYKAPFGRQELTSYADLQFVDRSGVSDFFTPKRDVGVMIHGQSEGGFFGYAAGVFNGDGEDTNTNDNNEEMFVGRVTFNPMGNFDLYEGDMTSTEDLGLSFGANYLYNPLGSDAGSAIFGVDTEANVNSFGLDGQLRFMGLSLQGEYFWREISDDGAPSGSNLDNIDHVGWYLQGGYFLIPEALEVAGRYGTFNVDDDNLGLDDDLDEWSVALNYYFASHNHKIQLDYTRLSFDPQSGSNIDDNVIRLQWQLRF